MAAAAAEALTIGGAGPVLRGESAGEGPPVLLCHGVTATRRYVLQGSRSLERAGYRVISYDARGHGESDPAPAGEDYGYPRLVDDLERVADEALGERRFFLAGHSMGAHTVVGYAMRHPERLAGLVVIGPVYRGEASEASIAYWDGLAAALTSGGVDAFVDYIDREQGIDPAWREPVLKFTRQRLQQHRHPEAVAAALRDVARSAPFGELAELGAIEVPTLVVASHDAADPGHPYETALAYAAALPNSGVVSELPGESPLAWQGGRLSRELATFFDERAAGI